MPDGPKERLKERLEELYQTYDKAYLKTDPLCFVHRFSTPEDQEIVGFLASSMAYGRVEQIAHALESIFGIMGQSPYSFARSFDPIGDARIFDGIRYRFHKGRDIAALVYLIRQMIDGWGSIEGFFLSSGVGKDPEMESRIENFSRGALDLDLEPFLLPDGHISSATRFFFPFPSRGSACKRLNLFLRWMVRRGDGVDLDLWHSIEPSELVIPLDTHVSRISYALGLTTYRTPSWRAACQVTRSLAEFDPKDPVKYDFSLCRLGILKACPARRQEEKCTPCLLREICSYR